MLVLDSDFELVGETHYFIALRLVADSDFVVEGLAVAVRQA